MAESSIMNGRIKDVSISMADHGILTFRLYIECEHGMFIIGNFQIGTGELDAKFWRGNGSGIVAMMKIMDVVGVERWEDLPGKYIRLDFKNSRSMTTEKIGNIIADKWFDIREFFSKDIGDATYIYEERSLRFDYDDQKVHEESKEQPCDKLKYEKVGLWLVRSPETNTSVIVDGYLVSADAVEFDGDKITLENSPYPSDEPIFIYGWDSEHNQLYANDKSPTTITENYGMLFVTTNAVRTLICYDYDGDYINIIAERYGEE